MEDSLISLLMMVTIIKNGELYLKHWYEGIELDVKYLEKVLPYIHQLWGRPVHMESMIEGKEVVFL